MEKEALEDTIKAQSIIIKNHENKIVEMDVIINNLTKIVEEWKAEKECRDIKKSDFEIELLVKSVRKNLQQKLILMHI